jgi:hypothetical protein
MKSNIIFAAALVIISGSCKKNDHHPQDIQSKLQGRWELRYKAVSWQRDSIFAPGNGSRGLTISGTTWSTSVNVPAGQSYTIIENPTLPAGVCGEEYAEGYHWKINFIKSGDTTGKYVHLSVSGDTLTLRQGCFATDGGRLERYVRFTYIQ